MESLNKGTGSDPVFCAKPRQPYWRRFTLLFAAFGVVTILVLRFSAQILLANSPPTQADFAVIVELNCGHCYRTALEQSAAGQIEGILLYATEPRRLELLGVIESLEENVRRELVKNGTAPEKIQLMTGTSRSDWETAKLVDAWLEEHQGKRVRVLCDRFSGSRWSFILDRTLSKQRRSSVSLEGIRDERYDETNWWRRRTGLKSYFCSLFRIAYARMHGEDQLPVYDWSAETYEARILK